METVLVIEMYTYLVGIRHLQNDAQIILYELEFPRYVYEGINKKVCEFEKMLNECLLLGYR